MYKPFSPKIKPINPAHISNALDLIQHAHIERIEEFKKYSSQPEADNTYDKTDYDSPFFDSFYPESGSNGIQKMTNFSTKEFDIMWTNVISV